jgi:hypothetical protein
MGLWLGVRCEEGRRHRSAGLWSNMWTLQRKENRVPEESSLVSLRLASPRI